jgi:hypothetical protein
VGRAAADSLDVFPPRLWHSRMVLRGRNQIYRR